MERLAHPPKRSTSGIPHGCEGDMKIEYNPRKFLLLVPMPMLHQYFDSRGVLADLPWDDLTEKDHERVYADWQALPQKKRDTVGADFLDVACLATKQGVQVIIEEGKFHSQDLAAELAVLPSHTEKAFHTLLEHPRVFRVARQLNYADNLTRYWHRRDDLPKKPPQHQHRGAIGDKRPFFSFPFSNSIPSNRAPPMAITAAPST
jgi:hypothetical protein